MKMIQIRNVPDRLHRLLKARAARAGTSLSSYLLQELERVATLPSWLEFRDRLASLPPVDLGMTAAEAVRRERDGR